MVKINLLSTFVLAFSMIAGTANAQIWGVGSGVGVADAEFANPFVDATSFAAGNNPTAWTALSVNENAGAVTPGAAFWTRSLLGRSQGAYWGGTTPIPTPSQPNGVAIFDSDFLDNAGTQGAFGTGTSPSPHRGELISPRIDLTGQTNIPLSVKFFTLYREFDIASLSVAMSTDDGATWSTPVDYRPLIADMTQGFANVLFATATQGVANLSQCRIKFIFDGDYYFALIDDVSIEVALDYDLAMGAPDPASTLLVGNGNYAKIGSNRYIPYDNIDPTDLTEWFWGGKVVNLGAADMFLPANIKFYMQIDFENPVSGAIVPNVYRDTMDIDTLYGGDAEGQSVIEYLRDLNFITANGHGTYIVKYWASSIHPEVNTANDTVEHYFTVTPGAPQQLGQPNLPMENYLSKARLSSTDGKVYASRGIFPGGGPYAAWEYGSVYYMNYGPQVVSVNLDSVHFRYRMASSFTGDPAQQMLCNVYTVDASQGVLDDGALLTQIGLAAINLTGLAASGQGVYNITSFLDAGGSGAMAPLTNNTFYFVSIITNPGLFGGAATFDIEDVPQIGVDEINYYMNSAMTDVNAMINPSPLNITDAASTTTWYWTGFGSDYVPSLGLFLGVDVVIGTETVVAHEGTELSLYPNPTSDVLNVSVKLDEAQDVMYILTDVTGRVLSVANSKNVTEETQSINVSHLPAGVYLLTARTDKGASTERFIKQ